MKDEFSDIYLWLQSKLDFGIGLFAGALIKDVFTAVCKKMLYWLKPLKNRVAPQTPPYLIYDTHVIRATYPETTGWLEDEQRNVLMPYIVVHDFRGMDAASGWARFRCRGSFQFPGALEIHKTEMVKQFRTSKRLRDSQENQPCPRVCEIVQDDSGKLAIMVQKAFYLDQVGTNLTLDYPLDSPVEHSGVQYKTVREWDLANSRNRNQVPLFEDSKLANTLGVAVGFTARDRNNTVHIVARLRSRAVAVYPTQWHVPVSFALEWPEGLVPGQERELAAVVTADFLHELGQEVNGLERCDFGALKPLALCRDMVRGGKPQLFCELQSTVSAEQLQRRMRPNRNEYRRGVRLVTGIARGSSPELQAFCFLVAREQT